MALVFHAVFFPDFESFALFPLNSAVKKIVSHGLTHYVLPLSCHQYLPFGYFRALNRCHIFSMVYLVTNEGLTLKAPITAAAENNFTFIYYFILFYFFFFFENKVLTFQVSHLPNGWFTRNVLTYFSPNK